MKLYNLLTERTFTKNTTHKFWNYFGEHYSDHIMNNFRKFYLNNELLRKISLKHILLDHTPEDLEGKVIEPMEQTLVDAPEKVEELTDIYEVAVDYFNAKYRKKYKEVDPMIFLTDVMHYSKEKAAKFINKVNLKESKEEKGDLLMETKEQGLKLLKNSQYKNSAEKLIKIFDEYIPRNLKMFIGSFVRFYIADTTIQDIVEFTTWVSENPTLLAKFPKKINEYTEWEELIDDKDKVFDNFKATQILNRFPPKIKNVITSATQEEKTKFKAIAKTYYDYGKTTTTIGPGQVVNSGKKVIDDFFKKIATLQGKNIQQILDMMDSYMSGYVDDNSYTELIKKINATSGAKIVFTNQSKGLIVARIETYSANEALACSTSWCIRNSIYMWNNYMRVIENSTYFAWNTTKETYDREFMFAVTVGANGEKVANEASQFKDDSGIGSNWKEYVKNLGIPVDRIYVPYKGVELEKKKFRQEVGKFSDIILQKMFNQKPIKDLAEQRNPKIFKYLNDFEDAVNEGFDKAKDDEIALEALGRHIKRKYFNLIGSELIDFSTKVAMGVRSGSRPLGFIENYKELAKISGIKEGEYKVNRLYNNLQTQGTLFQTVRVLLSVERHTNVKIIDLQIDVYNKHYAELFAPHIPVIFAALKDKDSYERVEIVLENYGELVNQGLNNSGIKKIEYRGSETKDRAPLYHKHLGDNFTDKTLVPKISKFVTDLYVVKSPEDVAMMKNIIANKPQLIKDAMITFINNTKGHLSQLPINSNYSQAALHWGLKENKIVEKFPEIKPILLPFAKWWLYNLAIPEQTLDYYEDTVEERGAFINYLYEQFNINPKKQDPNRYYSTIVNTYIKYKPMELKVGLVNPTMLSEISNKPKLLKRLVDHYSTQDNYIDRTWMESNALYYAAAIWYLKLPEWNIDYESYHRTVKSPDFGVALNKVNGIRFSQILLNTYKEHGYERFMDAHYEQVSYLGKKAHRNVVRVVTKIIEENMDVVKYDHKFAVFLNNNPELFNKMKDQGHYPDFDRHE